MHDAELVILAGDIDLESHGVRWANETFHTGFAPDLIIDR